MSKYIYVCRFLKLINMVCQLSATRCNVKMYQRAVKPSPIANSMQRGPITPARKNKTPT